MKIFFLGYGNIDRQDDGVAWHIVQSLMNALNIPETINSDSEMPIVSGDYAFTCQLQLLPELVEEFAGYEKIVFIDAHTGNVPEDVHIEELSPEYQSSPLTHHMTPATLLSLAQIINKEIPPAILVSVRGYEFKFTRTLSGATQELITPAVHEILEWIK